MEDRIVEIIDAERKIEKRIKRNEDNLRDLWDNIKSTNICVLGVPEGEKREKRTKSTTEEIIAENFPNMGNETVTQVQEAESPRHDEHKE